MPNEGETEQVQGTEQVQEAIAADPIVSAVAAEQVAQAPQHDGSMVEQITDKAIEAAQEIETEVEVEVDKVEQAVNAWISEHVHNSPLSQETVVYNYLISIKDKLIKKIKEVL